MASGKQVINARLDGLEMAWLADLEAQWGCNRTTALIRAIREAHERLLGVKGVEEAPVVRQGLSKETLERIERAMSEQSGGLGWPDRVIKAIEASERSIIEAVRDLAGNLEAPKAVEAPSAPRGRRSWAEEARHRLEEKAAAVGKCPDCGYDVAFCSCGATSL